MNIDVPDGYNVFRFGGNCVVPGARIHLRRCSDNAPFVGVVQPDGTLTLDMDEEVRSTVRFWPAERIPRVE